MHPDLIRCEPLTAPGLYSVLLRARDDDRADYLALAGEPLEPAREAATLATDSRWGAVILDRDGEAQAAVGAFPTPIRGCWCAWLHATDGWPGVWRAALRYVRDVMVPAMLAAGVRRCQALVVGPRRPAVRFLEACGLVREGVMRRFATDGRDVAMLARVA